MSALRRKRSYTVNATPPRFTASGCATGTASDPSAPRTPALVGAWGFDLTTKDRNVDPGNDVFRFVTGT